ncbi:hypothetical protein Tco_0772689 [Tanacetum coccineum]|uniref:Uncharacterized protein n=1 Tax=Tanacetum coccineum TaxID=301880 RepID=A0ABQ4ZMP4_9ASTR
MRGCIDACWRSIWGVHDGGDWARVKEVFISLRCLSFVRGYAERHCGARSHVAASSERCMRHARCEEGTVKKAARQRGDEIRDRARDQRAGPARAGHKKGFKTASCKLLKIRRTKRKRSWIDFDLDFRNSSMNYIPVRKENYAVSGGNVSTYDDVEDLDDQQFIVHGPSIAAVQDKHSEEYTADKEVPLSSEEQALHDELVSLMHQESIAKIHNDAQRNAFEKEKRRIALEKGKGCVDSTFTLSTANTPSQSTGNTPTDSDDDVPKDGVFSTNSFDDENTDTEEGGAADYNNMDPTIDVTSTPTLRIHKIHPQSQIIGKSTAGILTRRKLKESASDQHQALLSFIYKQNRTNHKDQQTCLFACFLSQEEPKKLVL